MYQFLQVTSSDSQSLDIVLVIFCIICSPKVREVRIWSGVLTESDVRQNMYLQRIDLVQQPLTKRHKCTLVGYWPMNRLISGPWPWQGSLVTCTSHLEEIGQNSVQLRIVFSTLP